MNEMANSPPPHFTENVSGKRRRILAAVTQNPTDSEDDNIVDEMDICNVMESQVNQNSKVTTSNALHALGQTIRSTLLEINVIREQNRERRHKEFLQMLAKIVQLDPASKTDEISSSNCLVFKGSCFEKERSYNETADDINEDIIQKEIGVNDKSIKDSEPTYEDQKHNRSQDHKTNTLAGRSGDKELQLMRTQMLELQKKKMADRERKKRDHLSANAKCK